MILSMLIVHNTINWTKKYKLQQCGDLDISTSKLDKSSTEERLSLSEV